LHNSVKGGEGSKGGKGQCFTARKRHRENGFTKTGLGRSRGKKPSVVRENNGRVLGELVPGEGNEKSKGNKTSSLAGRGRPFQSSDNGREKILPSAPQKGGIKK